MNGAELFLCLTNAIGDDSQTPIWRSHLISRAASRAAENQRFVFSANNAKKKQKCPTMIIAPGGEVMCEILSEFTEKKRYSVDLSDISNWYLDQSREDIVRIQ